MKKDIAGPETESTMPMREGLEGVVREKAQEFIQQIMEEEVTELLGREKSERRSTVDSAEGYRNGYGKPRRLAMNSGTITLRRPRAVVIRRRRMVAFYDFPEDHSKHLRTTNVVERAPLPQYGSGRRRRSASSGSRALRR